MEWQDKAKMAQLGNQARNGENKNEFHEFVLKHVDSFDEQAFDMFCNLIELIPDEMQADIEFYKKLYPVTKKFEREQLPNIGFCRFGLRLALLNTICEEVFKFKE